MNRHTHTPINNIHTQHSHTQGDFSVDLPRSMGKAGKVKQEMQKKMFVLYPIPCQCPRRTPKPGSCCARGTANRETGGSEARHLPARLSAPTVPVVEGPESNGQFGSAMVVHENIGLRCFPSVALALLSAALSNAPTRGSPAVGHGGPMPPAARNGDARMTSHNYLAIFSHM